MGESQVACALTNSPIYGECMFIVLGPEGYGPHGTPPVKRAGGCKFPGSPMAEYVCYWPLALPIYGSVSGCWGAMETCLDQTHDEYLQHHWGASAKEIVNEIIDGHGRVVGAKFRDHVASVDREKIALWDSVDDMTKEEVEKVTRAMWHRDLSLGKISAYNIERGLDAAIQDAVRRQERAVSIRDEARRNTYGARWADVMHVSIEAWREMSSAWEENKPSFPSKPDMDFVLSSYGRLVYQGAKGHDHFVDLADKMMALATVMLGLGGYRPSFIANHDSTIERMRLAVADFTAKSIRDQQAERE